MSNLREQLEARGIISRRRIPQEDDVILWLFPGEVQNQGVVAMGRGTERFALGEFLKDWKNKLREEELLFHYRQVVTPGMIAEKIALFLAKRRAIDEIGEWEFKFMNCLPGGDDYPYWVSVDVLVEMKEGKLYQRLFDDLLQKTFQNEESQKRMLKWFSSI